ncbi:hypothetical protein Ddye_006792 [Dipteronia dyeriana]|uniref:Uncharacterized protein n=1 Tax=Dipteronia dyeriana TaxID=168575 RepID=A0AAD9XIV9_9ROSI|nr:hypothetical protein Ddye_006792 [Dipteronia dyeriana]
MCAPSMYKIKKGKMGSKNCLIAWVILLLVYVLLLTSQVAARELDPLSGQKSGHFRELSLVCGRLPPRSPSACVPPGS